MNAIEAHVAQRLRNDGIDDCPKTLARDLRIAASKLKGGNLYQKLEQAYYVYCRSYDSFAWLGEWGRLIE